MPPKNLVESFIQDEMNPELDGIDYGEHQSEFDLIDALSKFSPDPVRVDGAELTAETHKLHGSPYIDFSLPNGVNIRKEIADFLFDAEALLPKEENERRGFLAQAKFDQSGSAWDVDSSQFHFIHHLPVFVFSRPKTACSFNLEPKYMPDEDDVYTGNTFATGLFGQQSEKPFLLRTERMLEGIANVEGSHDLRFQRSADDDPEQESFTREEFGNPTPHDYLDSVLGSFLKAQYGRVVVPDSELERFMDHMEAIATTSNYSAIKNPDLCTDGGIPEDDGFLYVKFTMDLRESNIGGGDRVF
jgi:hypothetical protein